MPESQDYSRFDVPIVTVIVRNVTGSSPRLSPDRGLARNCSITEMLKEPDHGQQTTRPRTTAYRAVALRLYADLRPLTSNYDSQVLTSFLFALSWFCGPVALVVP